MRDQSKTEETTRNVTRRRVMKVAGTSIVAGSVTIGTASAQGDLSPSSRLCIRGDQLSYRYHITNLQSGYTVDWTLTSTADSTVTVQCINPSPHEQEPPGQRADVDVNVSGSEVVSKNGNVDIRGTVDLLSSNPCPNNKWKYKITDYNVTLEFTADVKNSSGTVVETITDTTTLTAEGCVSLS